MEKENTSKLRKLWQKIMFEIELHQMDSLWRYCGGHLWRLFPPSFYYRHTPEEVERITEETVAYLQTVIDRYAAQTEET